MMVSWIFLASSLVWLLWLWRVDLVRAVRKLRRIRNKKVSTSTSTELATYEPIPVYETYGHPWMPIPELKGTIPRPPTGYAWEITASLNAHGNPALRLGLLDLGQGVVTAFAERDMVVIRRWQYAEDDTFAAFYRRAIQMHTRGSGEIDGQRAGDLGRQIFLAHLISPLSDWAASEVARRAVIDPPALSSSYLLVESA